MRAVLLGGYGKGLMPSAYSGHDAARQGISPRYISGQAEPAMNIARPHLKTF
jgi:hypothetical protein